MKVFLKNSIVVIVFLLSALSMDAANYRSTPKLKFKKGSSNTLVLKVSAVRNAIQVVLQDNEGGLLFTETLKKGYTYKKEYDISGFNNGAYYMKVVEAENVKFFKIEKGSVSEITEIGKLPFE